MSDENTNPENEPSGYSDLDFDQLGIEWPQEDEDEWECNIESFKYLWEKPDKYLLSGILIFHLYDGMIADMLIDCSYATLREIVRRMRKAGVREVTPQELDEIAKQSSKKPHKDSHRNPFSRQSYKKSQDKPNKVPGNFPTPYIDVNDLLMQLRFEAGRILGNYVAGMYLYGSLASGDFNPETSDIDFVVMTTDVLPNDLIQRLETMHMELYNSDFNKWSKKLEGSYVPQAVLRRHEPNQPPCPTINEGKFYIDVRGIDWIIQRHIIREHPVVLAGPDPKTVIDPVSPDDLRRAAVGILRDWWVPILATKDPWLRGDEYQAYAVLTMCRVLYTLEHGEITSKPVSARWAMDALDLHWRGLIERALNWNHGSSMGDIDETWEFIGYTVERSHNEHN